MISPTDINPRIVELLYSEALLLADDVRASFQLSGNLAGGGDSEDMLRVAHSCEGLRTTTRMMHVLAWLLNRRAYFAGDLSEFQLRRHGRLPSDNSSENEHLVRLAPEIRKLVEKTERFHARIARLDEAWRTKFIMDPPAIHRLHERIGHAIG
ncbi:DUF1465 family protein [Altererythrobacter aquiaggeris]|uniref:DUF1465 family protein n=1 Tax=Aestuarierythrobacter aquiaggeris TaxID=1898396 RepID=UPI003019F8D7